MVKIEEEKLLKAIEGSDGIVSEVARRIGVCWHTANKLIRESQAATEAMDGERQTLLDSCENTIRGLMNRSAEDKVRLNAAQFYLERIGKVRGFSTKQEIDHTTGGEKIGKIEVSFI